MEYKTKEKNFMSDIVKDLKNEGELFSFSKKNIIHIYT